MILKILEEKRSATVAELTELLNISEALSGRDIENLHGGGGYCFVQQTGSGRKINGYCF